RCTQALPTASAYFDSVCSPVSVGVSHLDRALVAGRDVGSAVPGVDGVQAGPDVLVSRVDAHGQDLRLALVGEDGSLPCASDSTSSLGSRSGPWPLATSWP